jgi:NAD(P)-dependent dehydrogenase (short-subunit alcohol dehydrogenase family)
MRTLEGKTALVVGAGVGLGRAVALALAARGVRIVLSGLHERALGEVVGEIANGGGKARHVVGSPLDAAHLEFAGSHAVRTFGSCDMVVSASNEASAHTLASTVAIERLRAGVVLFAVSADAEPACAEACQRLLLQTSPSSARLYAVFASPSDEDAAAQLAVFLTSKSGEALAGHRVSVSR